ncbi:hypothetical protein HanXRQr2_Chr11g0506841 [Helianthus annuus]|uniref:Uncharacterized protein n=1 Tax=Helianthus annuus TaxID=4232 RepID=A0A9K3HRL3_HELAN|nr:hypothetical protein HanXRQr2_Chr11g0506841 [Helianthus annuus]KAJ0876437.1 hypothetical protein HanPSC8_Chr11g0488461 [Helianthus annuus]
MVKVLSIHLMLGDKTMGKLELPEKSGDGGGFSDPELVIVQTLVRARGFFALSIRYVGYLLMVDAYGGGGIRRRGRLTREVVACRRILCLSFEKDSDR